ncbi:putative sulfate transporter [Rosellinia necatrix]|uniref:Putative sulfate transporter n=1 Tax=Rosellinia necatrix TaxID=77044 RepID=A0A1W2TMF4_ROSNE|nr:putative sulfate transporter [Rosellinia necatrix]
MSFLSNIKHFHRNNVATIRNSPLAEISGALGDLGTLLPLMITLAVNGSISLSTTLVFSGFFNIATGVVFGIPLPVQPMKAIAAAAIASRTSERETMAAGSVTAALVLILSVTGLIRVVTQIVPIPVIKGIQFGAGLSLVISAGSSLLQNLGSTWEQPLDNLVWAFVAFVLLILTQRRARFPFALIMFIAGVVIALVRVAVSHEINMPQFHVWNPYFILPKWSADAIGMGVAQLPLTILNSVIAVSALASDLLPNLPSPSVTAVGMSVAAMNLSGCWFGAMPVCHGSGGLAAQYRFGARSGASVMLLGLFKVVLGVVFGESLLGLLQTFPRSLLGIMVLAAGLELARVGQSLNHGAPDLWEASVEGDSSGRLPKRRRSVSDEERAERWTVMLITTAGILAFKNDAVGFVAGMLCHYAYIFTALAERKWHEHGHGLSERAPLLSS